MIPEKRRASQILVAFGSEDSEDGKPEKRQLIEELRDRTLAGESFAELAINFSEDPGSASQGGGAQ